MGRRDSNPRILVPKTSALPLGDAPIKTSITAYVDGIIAQKFLLVKRYFDFYIGRSFFKPLPQSCTG